MTTDSVPALWTLLYSGTQDFQILVSAPTHLFRASFLFLNYSWLTRAGQLIDTSNKNDLSICLLLCLNWVKPSPQVASFPKLGTGASPLVPPSCPISCVSHQSPSPANITSWMAEIHPSSKTLLEIFLMAATKRTS